MCYYRKGGLLSQNILYFQGGETSFSHKRDTPRRNILGVRHQIAVILDTACYVLDINIYIYSQNIPILNW